MSANFKQKGGDSEGTMYGDIGDMWQAELKGESEEGVKEWYGKAVEYWKQQPATVNGVLGGFEHVSDDDIMESAGFILPFIVKENMQRVRAIDTGAGIGRVAHQLLINKLGFATTDLLEPCAHMLNKAKEDLPSDKVGEFYEGSIQDHDFGVDKYDIITLQWVGIYLTDKDFVDFIMKARASLRPNGIIFIKENTIRESFLVDKEDSSITRTMDHYKYLITQGGGKVVKEVYQKKFPKELFKVIMFAVK